MKLRPYQSQLKNDIYNAWNSGYKNVLAVAPTGSGKTVIFSDVIKDHNGASCAIAHRQELVTQISLALARDDVPHRIIGPKNVVKLAVSMHMVECGLNYVNPGSPCAVAGVDTLVRRRDSLSNWLGSVTKWIQDEAHHVLINNKWGKAVDMFPNAIGLGVTATPDRADGNGLGRHADGIFDTMIEGPQMRALIDMGYLTDYRVFAPPSDIDLTDVNITATGEYNPEKLKRAVRRSHVIGDVVKHYLRIAPGKLGITFADSVETATDIAREYNAAGVPAAVVSAKTPDAERVAILRRFKNRELLQLVNVDLFGEGFDLPAIEVVIMARPTQSYALYCQQFGRALRLMIEKILSGAWDTYTDAQRRQFIAASIKPRAIIIDHVGNIERHNLPDKPRVWSLDRRDRKINLLAGDDIPVKACPSCTAVYERITNTCPYCGYTTIPAERSGPEFVDGNLLELDAATLAEMRGDVARVDMTIDEARADMLARHVPNIGITPGIKRHLARQEMQAALRMSIAWWGAYQREQGRDDTESYRRFYHKFGIDVLSAQALNTREALTLAERINTALGKSVPLPEIDNDSEAVQIIKDLPSIVKSSDVSKLTGVTASGKKIRNLLQINGFIYRGIFCINGNKESIYIRNKNITDKDIYNYYNDEQGLFNSLPDIITTGEITDKTGLINKSLLKVLESNGYIQHGRYRINDKPNVNVYVRNNTNYSVLDIKTFFNPDIKKISNLNDLVTIDEVSKLVNIPNKGVKCLLLNDNFISMGRIKGINGNKQTVYARKGTPAEHFNNDQIREALT